MGPTQMTTTTAIILCEGGKKGGKSTGAGTFPCSTTKGFKASGKGGKGGFSDYGTKKGYYGDNAFAVPVTTVVGTTGKGQQVQYVHTSGKGGSSQQVQVVATQPAQYISTSGKGGSLEQVQYIYTSGKGGKGG